MQYIMPLTDRVKWELTIKYQNIIDFTPQTSKIELLKQSNIWFCKHQRLHDKMHKRI